MAKVVASSTRSKSIKLTYYRVLIGGVLLLVISAALSIPFVYESQTLWYKVGNDKIMLRSGQMAGLLAAVLLLVQILLAARGKWLQQLFGVAGLMRWHRINGIIIGLLAIMHMLLVLIPEGVTNLPIGLKYWPEIVGMVLLCIIAVLVISAQWRQQLRLTYRRWRLLHRFLGYLAVVLMALHVLSVCDSFEQSVPRVALLLSVGGVMLAVFGSKVLSMPPGE